MKCPNCGTEVPKGNLYCPNCLEEIPWVKEFDTVETRMEKQRLLGDKDEQEDPFESLDHYGGWLSGRFRFAVSLSLCLLLAVVISLLIYFMQDRISSGSFEEHYSLAAQAMEKESYEEAMNEIQSALALDPDDLEANMLMARILEAQGDDASAYLVLKPMLSAYPDNIPVYQAVVDVLYRLGRLEEMDALINEAPLPEMKDACRSYISTPPEASIPPDTYTTAIYVSLVTNSGEIYYTLDGTEPGKGIGTLYTEPIRLDKEGTTQIRAVTVNPLGIVSSESSFKYVLVLNKPSPPVVTPDSGSFNTDTKIEVQVPDGCTAYYAFDEMPDENSTQYVQPISMPPELHTFYAVLVTPNGEISEATAKEYYLEY